MCLYQKLQVKTTLYYYVIKKKSLVLVSIREMGIHTSSGANKQIVPSCRDNFFKILEAYSHKVENPQVSISR